MTEDITPIKSNILTLTAWYSIEPILIRLYRLVPPAQLPVSFSLPQEANRARDWLYRYFREMNLKSLYRIRRESQTSFTILCSQVLSPIFHSEDIYNPTETFVREHFFPDEGEIPSEEEANKIARAHLAAGKINDTSFLAIMEEYRRVMGTDISTEPDLSALDSMPDAENLFDAIDKQIADTKDESIKRNDADGEEGTHGST